MMELILGMESVVCSLQLCAAVLRLGVSTAGRLRTNQLRACVVALMMVCVGSSPGEVIWAVNCGGDSHVDEYGIAYMRDPLQRTGVASDFGRSLLIQRVSPADQILYQTERYHTQSFTYEVPVSREGEYVLVLKFCEVWFTEPNQKVMKKWVGLKDDGSVHDIVQNFSWIYSRPAERWASLHACIVIILSKQTERSVQ